MPYYLTRILHHAAGLEALIQKVIVWKDKDTHNEYCDPKSGTMGCASADAAMLHMQGNCGSFSNTNLSVAKLRQAYMYPYVLARENTQHLPFIMKDFGMTSTFLSHVSWLMEKALQEKVDPQIPHHQTGLG